MNSIIVKKWKQQDMISKLPEVLLFHILSFLELKDAVRTSILSKRWEYLWTSIPNLSLTFETDYCEEKERNSFMKFVDRAIFLRESCIKLFAVKCDTYLDLGRLRGWITAIVKKHKVEELSINFNFGDNCLLSLKFPYCLFTSVSLTKLSINAIWTLQFAPSIYLSSLKHLSLGNVIFPDAESIESFISGCPMLETMSLLLCDWQDVGSVSICAPKLWKLEITEDEDYDSDIEAESCDIRISGPSLKYFCYEGDFINDYYLFDLPSLDEGKLHVTDDVRFFCNEDDVRLYKLLKGISHVKKLSLSPGNIWGLDFQTDLHNVPFFKDLAFLSFSFTKVNLNCKGLTKLLQISPCLETIRFERGVGLHSNCDKDGVLEPAPSCFLSHLKRIEVNSDSLYEINVHNPQQYQKRFVDAIEILLKRALVLEELVIHLPKGSNDDCDTEDADVVDDDLMDKKVFIRKVKRLHRASRVCRIQFP